MKKIFILLTAAMALLSNSCKDQCYSLQRQTISVADYGDINTVLNSFKVTAASQLVKPGNIYTYKNYLLVCEQQKGIHIMDNTNPASPVPLKYIELLGNENMAIKNDQLYVDNGTQMLNIDISDLNNINIVNVIPGLFNERLENGKIIMGYHTEEKMVKVPCTGNGNIGMHRSSSNNNLMLSSSESAGVTGKGGSMARFAVVNDYLYIAKRSTLTPIYIKDVKNPIKKLSLNFINNDVETLFPYGDNLFFGAENGVYIYNYKNSPETPTYVSTLSHVVGCDPVVVQDNYVFNTIRNGTTCRLGNSQSFLYVYDIKDIMHGVNLQMVSEPSPYGLGIKQNLLVVCNGLNGMMVYDWDERTKQVALKHTYPEIHAFDVIINNNTLIVTADNGLFQFNCTDPNNITYLSTLAKFN